MWCCSVIHRPWTETVSVDVNCSCVMVRWSRIHLWWDVTFLLHQFPWTCLVCIRREWLHFPQCPLPSVQLVKDGCVSKYSQDSQIVRCPNVKWCDLILLPTCPPTKLASQCRFFFNFITPIHFSQEKKYFRGLYVHVLSYLLFSTIHTLRDWIYLASLVVINIVEVRCKNNSVKRQDLSSLALQCTFIHIYIAVFHFGLEYNLICSPVSPD